MRALAASKIFSPRSQLTDQSLVELFSWSEDQFLNNTEGTAIRRIGHQSWQRNIAVAMGNADANKAILESLENALPDATPLVEEHIKWAIEQQKTSRPTADNELDNGLQPI